MSGLDDLLEPHERLLEPHERLLDDKRKMEIVRGRKRMAWIKFTERLGANMTLSRDEATREFVVTVKERDQVLELRDDDRDFPSVQLIAQLRLACG